jgi:hypothetical protein
MAGAPTLAGSRSGLQAGAGDADSATLHDGVVAAAVVLAMCRGLIVPKLVLDGLSERATVRAL